MMPRPVVFLILAVILCTAQAAEKQSPAVKPDKRPTKIWDRTGPLGAPPRRITDAYPLSDQENASKASVLFSAMSRTASNLVMARICRT